MVSFTKRWPLDNDEFPSMFLSGGSTVKGGPGSGNFGHKGRPGKRGGSSRNEFERGEFDPPQYSEFEEWSHNVHSLLTKEQQDTIYHYTDGEYRLINGHLRGRHIPTPTVPVVELSIQSLQSAMNVWSVPENIQVYRGVDLGVREDLAPSILERLQSGEIVYFEDPAFFSTTISRSKAAEFTGRRGVLFEINVTRGQRALPIYLSESGDEREILFPTRTRLQITSGRIEGDDRSGYRYIFQAEMVP